MAPLPQPTPSALMTTRHPPRDYCWGGPPWCHGGPWLSPGAIAAIVLGVILFLALVGCLCWTMTARRQRTRTYYAADYTQTTGVRGGGGVSDYEVSDFSSSTNSRRSGVRRMKKAKTRRSRHSRRRY